MKEQSGSPTKEEGCRRSAGAHRVNAQLRVASAAPFVANRLKDDGFVPPVNEIVPAITLIAAFGPRWSNLGALQETCHERRYVE